MGRWVNFSLKAPKQNIRLAVVGDGSECQGLIFCDFRKTPKQLHIYKKEKSTYKSLYYSSHSYHDFALNKKPSSIVLNSKGFFSIFETIFLRVTIY